jgi:hypothetical protein
VYVVPNASGAAGVNVAVVPDAVTLPAIAAPPAGVTVNVVVVIDEPAIASEKVAVTVVARATSVAPAAGVVAVTAGEFRSTSTPPSPLQEMSKGATDSSAPRTLNRDFIQGPTMRKEEGNK